MKKGKKERIRNEKIKNVTFIMICLIISLSIVNFISKSFIVATIPSESMLPILEVGDKIIVDTKDFKIEKGKIYLFYKDEELLIKRLIATEGDRVTIKDNQVWINGEEEKLEYSITSSDKKFDIDVVVPENSYFFLGDNRANSKDSRYWKEPFVKEEDLFGLAQLKIYPFFDIGGLYE